MNPCFFFPQRRTWVFLVLYKIWVYRESWIGLLQWAQGVLQSQDFLSGVLSGLWTGGLKQMCNLQMTGKQENANNWGSGQKREIEQQGRITAWRSSGVLRGELGEKSASLKGLTVSVVTWEGCSSTCASPGVSRDSWSRGSRDWLGSAANSSGNWKNTWEVAGQPSVEICFVLHLLTERNSWRQQLTCTEQWQNWMLWALPKPEGRW